MSRRALVIAALSVALIFTSCGDDDDASADISADETTTTAPDDGGAPEDSAATTTTVAAETTTSVAETTTTVAPEPLRILVTNDDGYTGPGLDAMVQALIQLPDVEVTVVAPSGNQSGTGSQTTPGELTSSEVTTPSGYPAIAVDGFPGDTVIWALANLSERPHVVFSGINSGQNIGAFAGLSGTVGAGRIAAENGLPAAAFSQGIIPPDQFDFASGVEVVLSFLEEHRDELLAASDAGTTPNLLFNVNIPSCSVGEVQGVVDVPLAIVIGDRDAVTVDCASTLTEFVDDVDAFVNGYAAVAEIDVPETFDAITAGG